MEPLVFEPYFRPQVWGGRRLEPYLGRPLPGSEPIGEAWVLSAQSLHISRVAEGALKGTPLTELWADWAEKLVGRPMAANAPFPLLFKYLDCSELLSIQVHPSDAIAHELRPGELGKTEAWVILDTTPTGRVYAGLKPGVSRADVERRLADGSLAQCLHEFIPQPGQCIFLRAGTVHAVGGGVLMAEVQQSSDATFRLFDWNRVGPDGKPRTLHTHEALRSIDWTAGPVSPSVGMPMLNLPGAVRGERLVACPYFSIDRFQIGEPLPLPYAGQLSVWMILDGAAELTCTHSAYQRVFRRGETVLIPASAKSLEWRPTDGKPPTLLGVLAE